MRNLVQVVNPLKRRVVLAAAICALSALLTSCSLVPQSSRFDGVTTLADQLKLEGVGETVFSHTAGTGTAMGSEVRLQLATQSATEKDLSGVRRRLLGLGFERVSDDYWAGKYEGKYFSVTIDSYEKGNALTDIAGSTRQVDDPTISFLISQSQV